MSEEVACRKAMVVEELKNVEFGSNLFVYEVLGDPVGYCVSSSKRIWSNQMQMKVATELALKAQHGQRDFFIKPIAVEVDFYMPASQPSQKKAVDFEGSWSKDAPELTSLMSFLARAATNILFKDPRIISSAIARKHFSHNPRTIFTIREL